MAGLLMAFQTVSAQIRVDAAGEQLVRDFVDTVETMEARFEQALIDAQGEVVERSSGTLAIARPGKFRWSYAEPYEQELVADGLNIWSYDVDLAQVTVKPQAEALANTPALLLGGDEEALDQFRFDSSTVENGTTWVRMIPLDTSSGFERMELGFVDGRLTRMAFFDNLEQTTLVALEDVVTNEPLDGERFVFTVPDEADLVGVPAVAAEVSP
ncbi:MAG: outer membrane lipoprotein chaperone LolA [Woeseiaceae bacterium]